MKYINFVFTISIFFFIFLCKSAYSNHEKGHTRIEKNALGVSELECFTETLDNGSSVEQCSIKEVDLAGITFTQNEKNTLKCWSNKPLGGETFYTLEFYFTFDIDNKEMRLEYFAYASKDSEMLIEEGDINLGYLTHLFENKHKVRDVTDSGMLFELKFNYPDIIYNPGEIIETVLTFTDGSSVDLELHCAGSPFLVAKFPFSQPKETEPPLMAEYLNPGDINMDNIKYHALIIGIDDYDPSIGDLNMPIADAKAINNILKNKYGFTTTLLQDPTREEIIDTMENYVDTLTINDNFLIYYAGHGKLDSGDEKASYWLPSDAKSSSKSKWISNLLISSWIKSLKSKHVLVIVDSCYAGALSRGTMSKFRSGEAKAYFMRLLKKQSRKVMASGGEEPVEDSGGGDHSVFAKALIDVLTDNSTYLETYSLFNDIRRKVIVNSDQTPEYEIIYATGDDGGEFIFVPK